MIAELPPPPVWWTEADQAELDLLTLELVRCSFAHREGCRTCQGPERPCAAMRDALAGVEEWRQGRILRSKAAYLRALEDERAAVE